MVGLNVGQAKVKFSRTQVWSQVFPVYLQIGEAVTPPLVKSRPILMRQGRVSRRVSEITTKAVKYY